jgi:predicted Zn-dependent peptidase
VVLGVQGGSSAETVQQKGAAHLISRITFEGNAAKSGIRTTRELEDLGAVFGAVANREAVVYTLRVPSAVLPDALAKLVDVVRTPIHRPYIVSENKDRAVVDYAPCGYKSVMEVP